MKRIGITLFLIAVSSVSYARNDDADVRTNDVKQVAVTNSAGIVMHFTPRHREPRIKVVEYDGHTYVFVKREVGYSYAENICRSKGGYLASINSDEERAFLNQIGEEMNYRFFVGGGYVGEQNWSSTGFICEFDKSRNELEKQHEKIARSRR